jgi:hypothetical protein
VSRSIGSAAECGPVGGFPKAARASGEF